VKRVPERHPLPRLLVFPLLILAGAGLALARFWPHQLLQVTSCPLRELTSIPCPTCGSTAAATSLAAGDPLRALALNPLMVLSGGVLAVWSLHAMAATLVPAWRFSLEVGPREKKAASYLAAILILANWVYLILR